MSLKKRKKNRKISRFSWVEFILFFTCLVIFSALPAIMYGYDTGIFEIAGKYLGWYLLYWAIMTALFCAYTAFEKYRTFDKPLNQLSDATKKVAEGDFSVYLKPVHTIDKADYIDQMFADFNRMVKELGSLETLKTDFVSNVSHEIKTPLSIIQNYATALQSTQVDEKMKQEYLQTIIQASQNLSSLVTNILSLNKLENQGIILPAEPYNVCEQLTECILSFDSLFTKKKLTIEAEIEDCAFIRADEHLIEIIWRNLLSNAVKFTPEEGSIAIKQYSTDNQIIVEVKDSGMGMDEATRKRIFEKFYQGDTSHSKDGNGLGMALVARVVDMMDGTLKVESKLDQGTTFTVCLNAYLN
ncbi:ATP-binding protein [Vagococcus entomophilus]|uniref:histidine kinase n=1 Tax=Vagococcus entomophilus TaxID=1160095 RepID=A0A430AGL3_9ENTE|nr:HAMP domain-containing sensor histidine kinase [Vagococcus entomophilus]RSU07069.1 two-component sensor histidine kinase [Vagococcus entomophilus]